MNDLLGDPLPETRPMNAPLPWRVFEMNDHPEWWVARTLEEAKAACIEAWGPGSEEYVEDAFELSDVSLESMKLTDDDCGAPVVRTFREELDRRVAAGLTEPEFFAGVE